MREIKFRAWDKKEKHWYGEFSANSLTFYGFSLFGECTMCCMPPVDYLQNLIIEQFTGLKDKTGVEIYDGDIVEIIHPCWSAKCEVKFSNGCFRFHEFNNPESNSIVCAHSFLSNKWEIKVIGNIHENKELLT